MKKGLILGFVLMGCTHQGPLNFVAQDFDILRTGDEVGTTTTFEQKLEASMDAFGKRKLTKKEQEEVKKAFNEGVEMAKKALKNKQSYTGPRIHYVVDVPYMNEIDYFLKKNPKAEGLHPELMLIGAIAYNLFPDWMVFEGKRTKERAEKLRKAGRSWTKNSRHTWNPAMAMDILAKDKRGKFSFKEIHRLGKARGVLYATYLHLKAEGKVCNKWNFVSKWITVTDSYHIQLDYEEGCKENPQVVQFNPDMGLYLAYEKSI